MTSTLLIVWVFLVSITAVVAAVSVVKFKLDIAEFFAVGFVALILMPALYLQLMALYQSLTDQEYRMFIDASIFPAQAVWFGIMLVVMAFWMLWIFTGKHSQKALFISLAIVTVIGVVSASIIHFVLTK